VAWAEVLGSSDIFLGVNALDYSGYPDCRPEYIEAYQRMATLATKAGVEGRKLTIHTPLLHLGKSQIVQLATEGLKPDLTLLFDLTIEESTSRTARRSNGKSATRISRDRLDIEKADFHARVREAYLQIARAEPERVKLIDTTGPVEQTQERVKEIIVPFLQSRGHMAMRYV